MPIDFETQIQTIAEWAEPQHSDQAEFHHFPHSWGVYEISMALADQLEAVGTTINRRVLGFAAITHDIHAHKPLDEEVVPGMTFASKEHRSAWIALHYLVDSGYDEETVAQPVHDLIVTTRRGEDCNSPEAISLRMADIFNTSEDFEVFEERALAFYRETCKFERKTCTVAEWVPGAMDFLAGFLDSNLPMWFTDKAKANIQLLRTKYAISGQRSDRLQS